jgi:NAD(P)-dependent dehydrogenase (short-subunit alcohol dehydrogenase family)
VAAFLEGYFAQNPTYRLWAVVNNAGIAPSGFIDWSTFQSFRNVMEVNYFGTISVIKAFLPFLKRCRHSRIINISSMAGIVSTPSLSAYCASKHAVEGLSQSIRYELIPWGIYVCTVNPGFMRTPLIASSIDQAQRDFEAAPADIRDQYPSGILSDMAWAVRSAQEDPRMVVNAIADLVLTPKKPPLRTVVGYYAWALYFFECFVPISVKDYFLSRSSFLTAPTKSALEKFQGPQ